MADEAAPEVHRWLVSGFVQGVGFRWFVRARAARLGLQGWVRNLPGGQVEVVARGPRAALELLQGDLRRGPSAAHVENVEKLNVPREVIGSNTFEVR